MHDLFSQTALGADAPQCNEIGALRIEERSDIALASVTARMGVTESCLATLEDLLGGPVPQVGKTTFGQILTAFWIAPEQWMIAAPFDSHEAIAQMLRDRLRTSASVTEQTDGWVIFDVSGPLVVSMFERLCPVPVRRMAAGDVQRSTIHHMGCLVLCREAGRRLQVLGPRSSAGSLHHALCTAARAVV